MTVSAVQRRTAAIWSLAAIQTQALAGFRLAGTLTRNAGAVLTVSTVQHRSAAVRHLATIHSEALAGFRLAYTLTLDAEILPLTIPTEYFAAAAVTPISAAIRQAETGIRHAKRFTGGILGIAFLGLIIAVGIEYFVFTAVHCPEIVVAADKAAENGHTVGIGWISIGPAFTLLRAVVIACTGLGTPVIALIPLAGPKETSPAVQAGTENLGIADRALSTGPSAIDIVITVRIRTIGGAVRIVIHLVSTVDFAARLLTALAGCVADLTNIATFHQGTVSAGVVGVQIIILASITRIVGKTPVGAPTHIAAGRACRAAAVVGAFLDTEIVLLVGVMHTGIAIAAGIGHLIAGIAMLRFRQGDRKADAVAIGVADIVDPEHRVHTSASGEGIGIGAGIKRGPTAIGAEMGAIDVTITGRAASRPVGVELVRWIIGVALAVGRTVHPVDHKPRAGKCILKGAGALAVLQNVKLIRGGIAADTVTIVGGISQVIQGVGSAGGDLRNG